MLGWHRGFMRFFPPGASGSGVRNGNMGSDIAAMLTLATIIAMGVLLCLAGDYIRRRTGGRIRHAEAHLLAWLPVPGFYLLAF